MRLDGNVSNYGFYSVMVDNPLTQIYGWTKDPNTGVYSYLYDGTFGKAWRDNGSSTIEVNNTNILNFFTVTL